MNVGGETFKDNSTRLEWMRCAVGQEVTRVDVEVGAEYYKKNGRCKGTATRITYQQAISFTKKIGHGWRMPTIFEIETLNNGGLSDFRIKEILVGLTKGRRDQWGDYYYCENGYFGVWSTTPEKNKPNNVMRYECQGRVMGEPMYRVSGDIYSDDGSSLILVKDFSYSEVKPQKKKDKK